MRFTPAQMQANERRIREAIERLLAGDIPPGARCNINTLAKEAGVWRGGFHGDGPYAHLRIEFEQRLESLRQAGMLPDVRDRHIASLKSQVTTLQQREAKLRTTIKQLTEFRTQALSRLAAQHDEITRLRASTADTSRTATRQQ